MKRQKLFFLQKQIEKCISQGKETKKKKINDSPKYINIQT